VPLTVGSRVTYRFQCTIPTHTPFVRAASLTAQSAHQLLGILRRVALVCPHEERRPYRCRLPSWTAADEKKWDGTYNARRDKLTTAWRELWGKTHGVMLARRIFESVALHVLEHRPLAPGERPVSVEVEFRPEPEQDLLLACLWRYVQPEGDEPGFYTVAAITVEPLPDFIAAGHDRSVIAIRPENVDAWLDPMSGALTDMVAILDDPVDVSFEYRMVERDQQC